MLRGTKSLTFGFLALPQDLAKSKSTIAALESTVTETSASLASAQSALEAAQSAPAPVVADASPELAALKEQLATAQSDMADLQDALKRTQEDAMSNNDAITKIGEQELASKEEDHVNSLAKLRRELEGKATQGGATAGEDIARLHEAHSAKLSQVEADARARIAELESVSVED